MVLRPVSSHPPQQSPSPAEPSQSQAQTLFNSIPWQHPTPSLSAWHKRNIPYLSTSNSRQTLDLWLPTLSRSPFAPTPTSPPTDLRKLNGYWLLLLHGGAWRDPKIGSHNFAAPMAELLFSTSTLNLLTVADTATGAMTSPVASKLAGIVSIGYTLSPYNGDQGTEGDDRSRAGVHPRHVLDVLAGLHFLRHVFGDSIESNGILVGHSCGATLALQSVMASSDGWGSQGARQQQSSGDTVATTAMDDPPSAGTSTNASTATWQPPALLLIAGLYDLPLLGAPTTPSFQRWTHLYRAFLTGGFTADETMWRQASPTFHASYSQSWPKGKLIVLADSPDDGMVPPEQVVAMAEVLERQGWTRAEQVLAGLAERQVLRMELGGPHDEVWEKGWGLARACAGVVERLEAMEVAAGSGGGD